MPQYSPTAGAVMDTEAVPGFSHLYSYNKHPSDILKIAVKSNTLNLFCWSSK